MTTIIVAQNQDQAYPLSTVIGPLDLQLQPQVRRTSHSRVTMMASVEAE